MAVGHPLVSMREQLSPRHSAYEDLFIYSVSRGVVSAVGSRALQFDAPSVAPGSSGGPLLDCEASVVGVVTGTSVGSWNNLKFARKSGLLLHLRDARTSLPSRPTVCFHGAIGVAVQHARLWHFGGVVQPALSFLDTQLRAVGEFGILFNGSEPSEEQALDGWRRRVYGSLGVAGFPKLGFITKWIRPGITLGYSVMGDHYSTRDFRLDASAPGGISRVGSSSTLVSFRPVAGLEVRMADFVVSYAFHVDTEHLANSVHGLTLGAARELWTTE